MKVAVIGPRVIARKDADVIAFEMIKLVQDPEVEEIIFPGLDGVAANALCFAIGERAAASPKLTVVFPGKYGERPWWSQRNNPSIEEWAQKSNQILELGLPMGGIPEDPRKAIDISWDKSMTDCNVWVVNYVATTGQALVFWDGSSLMTDVTTAIKHMKEKVIPWVHVEVAGEEDP